MKVGQVVMEKIEFTWTWITFHYVKDSDEEERLGSMQCWEHLGQTIGYILDVVHAKKQK